MILEQIYLENWKDFRDPIDIKFSDGINIIYGPNESGKSTVIGSLPIVFFQKYKGTSQIKESIIPWNTKLTPKAVINFKNNGEKYQITKIFLNEPKSILKTWINGDWEKIAENNDSDKEIADILGGKISTSRKTTPNPEEWGLAQCLWMQQGKFVISKKEKINEETISSLRPIDISIESFAERSIIKKIEELHKTIFTPKTNEYSTKSEINKLNSDILELKSKLDRINDNLARKNELIRDLEDDEIKFKNNRKSLEKVQKTLQELQNDIDEANKHELEREKYEGNLKHQIVEYNTLKEKYDDLKELKKKLTELQSLNTHLLEDKEIIENKISEISKKTDNLGTNLNNQKVEIKKLENERNQASIAKNTIQEEIRIELLKPQLKEAEELEKDLEEKKKQINTIITPSNDEIKLIQEKLDNIRSIQAKLEVIGLKIDGYGEGLFSGIISVDGVDEEFNLFEGDKIDWNAYQSVKIKINKLGMFEIKSGSQDVKQMQNLLEEMELDYNEFLTVYQCRDLDEIRHILNKKNSLITDCNRIKSSLNKKFKDGKNSLLIEIRNLESKINRNWDSFADNSPYKLNNKSNKMDIEDCLSKKLKDINSRIDKFEDDFDTLNLEKDNLLIKQKKFQDELSTINSQIYGNEQLIENTEERVSNLEKDGIKVDESQENLKQFSLKIERKKSALEALREEIDEKEKKPKELYEAYKNKETRLKTEKTEIELSKMRNETDLKNLIREFGDINKIEEMLKFKKNLFNQLKIKAGAINLLNDLNKHYQNKIKTSLTAPIQKTVSENLKELIGPKYDVKLDNNLKPCSVETVYKNTAEIEDLSFGTREQIWCLFRLALGQSLSKEEKQLVVLEDPFVNTDQLRMERALQILEKSSKDLQIIILTCDLDKYDILSNANLIPLV